MHCHAMVACMALLFSRKSLFTLSGECGGLGWPKLVYLQINTSFQGFIAWGDACASLTVYLHYMSIRCTYSYRCRYCNSDIATNKAIFKSFFFAVFIFHSLSFKPFPLIGLYSIDVIRMFKPAVWAPPLGKPLYYYFSPFVRDACWWQGSQAQEIELGINGAV